MNARLFAWIFEAHPDGVLVVDGENRVVSKNRRLDEMCRAAGEPHGAGELADERVLGLLHGLPVPEDVPPDGMRDEVVLRDGRHVERQCSPLRARNRGMILGAVWFYRDITARKEAESNLWVQLEELQRWQELMLGREWRMAALKREVNELCARVDEPIRYPSQAGEEEVKTDAGVTGSAGCSSAEGPPRGAWWVRRK